MMFNNHYCIQGICNRGFTLDCVLDILWIGFIFVTDKNWFYLVSICILNSGDESDRTTTNKSRRSKCS